MACLIILQGFCLSLYNMDTVAAATSAVCRSSVESVRLEGPVRNVSAAGKRVLAAHVAATLMDSARQIKQHSLTERQRLQATRA